MNSQDLHEDSETPPPSSSNLQPKEQKLKDAVIKMLISRYHSSDHHQSPCLAQKIKLIEDNISSFFPLLRIRPTHPPYATMIMESIKEMNNDGGGSNVYEISNYIEKNFQGLPFAHSHFLKHYLKKLVDSGEILYSYSTACYELPEDLNCKPNRGCENEHEQHQQKNKKRSRRGRLCKKYVDEDEECEDGLVDSSGDDGLVDSINLSRNSSEECFEVENESVQFYASDNEELMMESGTKAEKHQRVDYSNIVIGLAADNTLQQFTGRGRPSRMQVNQRGTVEQHQQQVDYSSIVVGLAVDNTLLHHQSDCAKRVLETTGKRKSRGRPRKIPAHQQEVGEKPDHNVKHKSKPGVGVELGLSRKFKRLGRRHSKMPVKQDTTEQSNPNGDSSPVDEIEEGTLQQRKSRGRGRPRKIHAHQQKIAEEHHQNTDATLVGEVGLGLLQKPCQGTPLRMQLELETVEQRNPTSDCSVVVENEGGSSQQQQSKVDKMRKKTNFSEPSPPQDMSEVMQQTVTELGGTTPVNWLFEKILSMSDVKPNQGRIFITRTVTDLLTPAEREKYWVLMGNTDQSTNNKERKKGCTVMLVEPDGRTSEIVFKIWGSMGKDKVKPVVGDGQPVLTGSNWNALVRKYSMQAGTKLQFWCFRNVDTNGLCFAMNNKTFHQFLRWTLEEPRWGLPCWCSLLGKLQASRGL